MGEEQARIEVGRMTYLDRILHVLDWLFSNRAPDEQQFAAFMALWLAACLCVYLGMSAYSRWRNRHVPR